MMFTNPMFTKIIKLVCAGALLVTAFWVAPPGVEILRDILISVGAITVATEAVALPKYLWAAGFVAIAVLFNPIAPVALSRNVFLVLDLACLLAFMISLEALKSRPILSIPSITNRTPGSQSL
ncbi:MAG TPA: DUF6804 family protein [Terriglobia bacterium]|nr:DUF6804 family protein [Terriglobia bacterium]